MKTLKYIIFFFILIWIVSCISVKKYPSVPDWWLNREQSIAEITDNFTQQESIVQLKFEYKDSYKKMGFVSHEGFRLLAKGARYLVYYNSRNIDQFIVDFSNPVFTDCETKKTLTNLTHKEGYFWDSYNLISRHTTGNRLIEFNYLLNIANKVIPSTSFIKITEPKKIGFKVFDNPNHWYKVKYCMQNPGFSQIDITTPFKPKGNSKLFISEIDENIEKKLTKLARKMNQGDTIYWANSYLDWFSENPEFDKEKEENMKIFLESFLPQKFLSKNIEIKVVIVNENNVKDIFVPVKVNIKL